MKFQSVLAIYILFWTMSLFVVLPFGVRTPEEEGVKTPPATPPARRTASASGERRFGATIVSAAAFALFYANYVFGWVTIEMLDWTR